MRREDIEAREAALLDGAWYLLANPDVAFRRVHPLYHYQHTGRHEARCPNFYFDPPWYIERSGANVRVDDALTHYVTEGEARGLFPCPWFDPAWYRRAFALPPDVSPLAHFLGHRFEGGYAPNPDFYGLDEMTAYRELARAGVDPFERFAHTQAAPDAEPPGVRILANSGLFDANHYLAGNSDVIESAVDPLAHFAGQGWKELRSPNPYFDVEFYLKTNPDAARLEVNPMVHYFLHGEAAGRRPVLYFDPAWYRATYDIPPRQCALAHYLAQRRTQTVSPLAEFDVAFFKARNRGELRPARDPFMVFLALSAERDIDPNERFDSAAYRKAKLGRRSRYFMRSPEDTIPLLHYLRETYR
jgi:hypothetical protein